MKGKTEAQVAEELQKAGITDPSVYQIQLAHKQFRGNKPTNSIIYQKLNPFTLGSLIGKWIGTNSSHV